jgi:hypothetical protein
MNGVKKNILLLTATIAPKGLLISNHNERLQEYKYALSFYQTLLEKKIIDGIVFAENSGYDLQLLKQEFPSAAIEWLSYRDLDYPKEYHRGYGEFRLIDFAFKDSQIIAALAPDDAIWKISGRYILRNMKSMIRRSTSTYDLYCHLVGKWAELSVIAWSPKGYSNFIKNKWQLFTSDMVPELILAVEFRSAMNHQTKTVLNYQWPPLLEGRRGSDGSSYQGRLVLIKHAVKVIATLAGIRR